jgi:hypothetical protein
MQQFDNGIEMKYDSTSGRWISSRRLSTEKSGSYDVRWSLFLEFRVSGSLIGKSELFRFDLAGRPDLVFTGSSIPVSWNTDSLRFAFQILNRGNTATPGPYPVVFFWGEGTTGDTLTKITAPALAAGAIADFSHAIPDTQGDIVITGHINPQTAFKEIAYDNNTAIGRIQCVYRDMHFSTDTIKSFGKGLAVFSAKDSLSQPARFFLFKNSIIAATPLPTQSVWPALDNESYGAFSVFSRPVLSDTMSWRFMPDPVFASNVLLKTKSDTVSSAAFTYDSVSDRWYSVGGSWQANPPALTLKSRDSGPFALGTMADRTPPVIQVFVGGREILFLDYAAKGKPFNIMISDPSGIRMSSVQVLLNKEPMETDILSGSNKTAGETSVSLTAYPAPQKQIDTLTVTAQDYAGNTSRSVFAYMPGEDLSIRFLSCHPNPFNVKPLGNSTYRQVRFAFLLTDIASEVNLSVYTVSGRKIWVWKNSGIIGYQEVPWNGLDREGYRIANGTYYAKLVAKSGKKSVKKTIRIAKLEGY